MSIKSVLFCLMMAVTALGTAAEDTSNKFEKVFQEHLKQLQNLDKINPHLIVFLSGAFGMGKTTVSKQLENNFQAIRLNGDHMRDLLTSAGISKDKIDEYFLYCMHRLHSLSYNRFYIVDRCYENNEEYYRYLTDEFGLPTFLIRLEVPKKIAMQRIISRNFGVNYLLSNFEESYAKYMDAGQRLYFDYVLDNSQEGILENEELMEKIADRFRFQSPENGSKDYDDTRESIMAFARSGKSVQVISNFSTILPGLYVGSQDTVSSMLMDERRLVSDIISCRAKPFLISINVCHWMPLQILDFPAYRIIDHFEQVFDFVENAEQAVFVHCQQGISRSTTLLTAYLMRKYQLPYSVAYTYLQKKHAKTLDCPIFENQLLEYQERLGISYQ